jgi:hypothetical protein
MRMKNRGRAAWLLAITSPEAMGGWLASEQIYSRPRGGAV